ncbi:MAG: 5'/3'-nucleotidase SurE [Clostridia bacterium]|nr:5'/3'-nucleotidase SurE [Clostridia bacterium]
MRILITNDDGVNSIGINTLADVLNEEHEVYVVAPSSQRSAAGHGISLGPITYTRLSSGKYALRISADATPADCVKLAVLYFMKDRLPDLVISGINEGANIGSEIIYSGTVSAALEGAYLGFPSIAVSNVNRDYTEGYEKVARLIAENLERLADVDFPRHTALNVNYPSMEAKGIKITEIGINRYTDIYTEVGENTLVLGGLPDPSNMHENTDVIQISKGYVTVSAVTLDKNDYNFLQQLRRKFVN